MAVFQEVNLCSTPFTTKNVCTREQNTPLRHRMVLEPTKGKKENSKGRGRSTEDFGLIIED